VQAERAEQTVEQIEAAIVDARAAGDVQTELTLLRKHATAVQAAVKAKEKPPVQQQSSTNGSVDLTKTPEFQSFLQANPWWSEDAVMRTASIEIQNQMFREGKISAATPMADRLAAVAEATRAKFGMKDSGRRGGHSRVEGGGGPGGDSGGSTSAGKSFSDLPADAKEACNKAARRLKIGKGQKYETLEAWQKSYATIYFST
jgi:hypothetical protein